ncbi:MAG: hypothetical protein HKO66_09235 [Saprospiraceae bacterium]|nr:hypothetical protein [Bacteroidia bacterium]NNE15651.1 hypothetical protein [Saprospiraceae bacterium]NNL92401.1 hypothetical protein [Saprospiraceae bacterium]
MNDKRFDDILRSKLSNLDLNKTPQWDLFKEKKKAAKHKQDDAHFDNAIRHNLANHSVAYNVTHWHLLKARLNHIFNIRRKVLKIKSLELSVIFLTLFCGLSISDYSVNNIQPNNAALALTENIEKINAQNDNQVAEQAALETTITPVAIEKKEQKSDVNNNKVFVRNNVPQDVTKNVKSSNLNASFSTKDILNNKSKQLKANEEVSSLNAASDNNTQPLNAEESTIENDQKDVASIDIQKLQNIDVKGISFSSRALSLFPIKPIKPLVALDNSSWIHVFGTFDNNMIHTPNDLDYKTTERVTEMYGFTLGGLFSKRIKSIELETGISFSTYSKPWNFVQQHGNAAGWYTYSLTNIAHTFLAIPLQVKHHFVENVEWSIFGKVGITPEVIMSSAYTSNNKYIGGGAHPIGTLPPESEIPTAPFELDHEFTQGLLGGDGLSDNLFVRSHIGLGLERIISPNTAVYIIGEYHIGVINKSIGPNNDKINKAALNVGVKFKL